MENETQEAFDDIDLTLAQYHEGIGATALIEALKAERKDFQDSLAAGVCLGLMGFDEERQIYIKHGWQPPELPDAA